eukprot:m.7812 g.7812  ORF g.7812 m.7812 type:complete len:890 (+) comp5917_c0_seq2:238-2907(+)
MSWWCKVFFQAPVAAMERENSRVQLEYLGLRHSNRGERDCNHSTANNNSSSSAPTHFEECSLKDEGECGQDQSHSRDEAGSCQESDEDENEDEDVDWRTKKKGWKGETKHGVQSSGPLPLKSRTDANLKKENTNNKPSHAIKSPATTNNRWSVPSWTTTFKRNSSKVVPFQSSSTSLCQERNDHTESDCDVQEKSLQGSSSSPELTTGKKSVFHRISKLGTASVFQGPDSRKIPIPNAVEKEVTLSYFVIHPYSTFRWYWDLLMVFMLIFTVVSVPVAIAFFYEGTGKAYFVCSCIIDSLFLVDIFINFRTGIVSPHALHVIILDKKAITRHYLRGWFFVDLISSLPLDYIITACYGVSYDSPSYLKASRALKFIRVTKLLTLLRLLRVTRVFRMFRRWEEVLNVNTAWVRMFKLVVLMLLMSHWSGCIQFLAAQIADFPEDSWVAVNGLVDSPASVQYSWALFKALSHMLCIGYGRFPPRSVTEAWFTMFSMVIGATFYAIFIGQISSITLSIDSAGRVYREKVKEAAEYLRARKVPAKVKRRVFDYYEYRWAQRKYFDEQKILEEISPGLRAEIIKHNCEPLVQSLPFLRNASQDLIEAVTTRVTFHVVMPGEVIIRANTYGSEMFLLQYGVVEVILPNGETVANLEDGSYFGEMSLLHEKKRAASVCAKTACKLYVISQEALKEVEREFPSLTEELVFTAKRRLMELKQMEKATGNGKEDMGDEVPVPEQCLCSFKFEKEEGRRESFTAERTASVKHCHGGRTCMCRCLENNPTPHGDSGDESGCEKAGLVTTAPCKLSVMSSNSPNTFCLSDGDGTLSYGGSRKVSVMHTRNAWKRCNVSNRVVPRPCQLQSQERDRRHNTFPPPLTTVNSTNEEDDYDASDSNE